MKVLITGGTGYLGSVLSQLLLRSGYEVRALDNLMYGGPAGLLLAGQDGFELVRADIRDHAEVSRALEGVDGVIHLAAIVGDPACAKDPEAAKAVNLEATIEVARQAAAAGVRRFVFASTCSNYGKMADTSSLATEDHELLPVSLYAETKVAAERGLLRASGESMSCTVLRFATLYGLSPRMRFDLTVNQFVVEALTTGKLVVFGEQFWRTYVHVRDAARAIACVLEAPPSAVAGGIFNVGDTRENYRKIDLVEIIQGQLGKLEVEYVHQTDDPRDYRVSFDRIHSKLGYSVTRNVPAGVAEVAGAIRQGLVANPGEGWYYNVKP